MNKEEYVRLIPGNLDHIVSAGEQVIISEKLKRYLRKNKVYLHNHYGPSETHVVTALTLDSGGEIPERPSIGRPVSNTAIYILDKGMHLVPVGVAGELAIAGIQVGWGYLNRPGLTTEKFIEMSSPSPLAPHTPHTSRLSRFYKTGDLARCLPDGNIEFLGRIDHQVKIRGFRVELGEIETQLMNHPGIKEVVVLARAAETGDKNLCAYIVPDKEPEAAELRGYLSRNLPDYMVPAYFIFLDKIPLTPNRKIDHRKLPVPQLKAGDTYTEPSNEQEEKLAKIWQDILGIQKIGIDDNFFELGGHSLNANLMITEIHKKFNVRIPLVEIFKLPSIKEIAAYITGAVKETYISIEKAVEKSYYALTSSQKRMYFNQQINPGATYYNFTELVVVEGEMKKEKLGKIFRELLKRHESLRTSFLTIEGEPVQKIHRDVEFEIAYHDLSQGGEGAEKGIIEDFVRPFDLSRPPLLRVGLIKLGEKRYILMVDMHHLISDEISREILINDFFALNRGEKLPPLRLQYKDYSEWQNRREQSSAMKQQEAYWLKQFEDEIPLWGLPTDYKRPKIISPAGNHIHFEIHQQETRLLKKILSEEDVTLFMVLFAVYNIFLSKICMKEDIVVGTPANGRRHADLNNIMGFFVNTLPIRNYPGKDKTFRQFLQEVKQRTLDAFENQDYQFQELIERVPAKSNKTSNRNPLFDTMFTLVTPMEQSAGQEPGETGIKWHYYDFESNVSPLDLYFQAIGPVENLCFTVGYSTELFKKETIERFTGYFKQIIKAVVENKDIRLKDIRIFHHLYDQEISIPQTDFNF